MKLYLRFETLKTLPYWAAHTYLAPIWEYPLGSFSAVLWVVTQRSSPQTAAKNRTIFLFPLWGGGGVLLTTQRMAAKEMRGMQDA